MGVAGPGCDPDPDTCFGARGPNCNYTGVPNTGCYDGDPRWGMRRSCAVSIGAQRHDTCCSHHPGGVSSNGITEENCQPNAPSEFCQLPCVPPTPLAFSDSHSYSSPYQFCAKEWDQAWGDDTNALHATWRQWFDSTIMTYKPSDIVQQQGGSYHYDLGPPIPGVS